jgi:predicted amidohydrolase YtcJ
MRRLAAALVLLAAATVARAEPNLILTGGAIYTLDPARPWASALVVAGGHIAYVGDAAGAKRWTGRRIDLHGRMVLPGFHDAHAHPMNSGMTFLRCRLGGLETAAAVADAIRACDRTTKEAWLIASGWSASVAPPDRAALDRLVPDKPAYLATEEGFAVWVNTRTLEAAGVDPKTMDGLAKDDVLMRIRHVRPEPTSDAYRAAFGEWSRRALALGIASVFDANASPAMVEAYHAADLAHTLRQRVVAAQFVDPARGPDQVDAMAALRDRTTGPRFAASAAKIFLDGEIGQHTAALLADYADAPGERGRPYVTQDALDALVRRLDAAGFLLHMHVMGDAGAREALDAIERAEAANGARDRRPQLAHLALVDPADMPRFAALGVAADFTPMWFRADDPATADTDKALDPARRARLYPIASLSEAGARLTASSDWPSASMSPLDGIEAAVARERQPDQRLSLDKILAAYTRDAAWAVRGDGVLAAGKAADLVVLDRNLFEIPPGTIHEARVMLTMIDGEIAWRAKR